MERDSQECTVRQPDEFEGLESKPESDNRPREKRRGNPLKWMWGEDPKGKADRYLANETAEPNDVIEGNVGEVKGTKKRGSIRISRLGIISPNRRVGSTESSKVLNRPRKETWRGRRLTIFKRNAYELHDGQLRSREKSRQRRKEIKGKLNSNKLKVIRRAKRMLKNKQRGDLSLRG